MAIASLDGLIAALPGQQRDGYKVGVTNGGAGTFYTFATATGQSGALTTPAVVASNGTVYDNTSTNAWPFTNPSVAGYLARVTATPNVACTLFLYDLLWAVTWTATVTGAQAITFPTVPSRDVNGAALGAGVELWFNAWAAIGATSATLQITYTDQDGNASQVTTAETVPNVATAGRCFPFRLAAGDTGVRSVQSINSSATMTSGTPTIMMMRRLATIPCPVANTGAALDFAALGMPRTYSGTNMLWVAQCTATTALTSLLSTTVVDG